MKHVIVSRNDNEEVWVATPTGKILAKCFFKAEDETADELRQMGYRSLTEKYRRAHITRRRRSRSRRHSRSFSGIVTQSGRVTVSHYESLLSLGVRARVNRTKVRKVS